MYTGSSPVMTGTCGSPKGYLSYTFHGGVQRVYDIFVFEEAVSLAGCGFRMSDNTVRHFSRYTPRHAVGCKAASCLTRS